MKIYYEKSQRVNDKYIAFVKENGNLYYSFWLFRKGMIVNSLTPIDTLFKIYNTVFPDSLKNSIEGEFIESSLKSRNLKKRDLAPNFNLQDVRGKDIKLPNYKGKYILLTFWASWCGPCIKEIPTLLKIKEKYPSDKLEIISINLDDDSTSFSKAVQKYKMEWVHIFGDKKLRDVYGVMGIPEVFLINKSGEIIYKRGQEKDYDSKLPILNNLLVDSL
jgi:thiol-disulfide isomerase/thioredoxin